MPLGRLLMHVGWTLVLPGAGHGALGRRVAMVVWAVLGTATAIGLTWTVWALFATAGVRVASAADAAWRLRRSDAAEHPWLPLVASAIGLVGVVYFVLAFERFAIPTDSMTPTIAVGETVYVEKVSSAAARGDVIVFVHPCDGRAHVKRVVAVGGDRVEVRCGVLHVNDARVGDAGVDFPNLDGLVRACRGSVTAAIVPTRPGAAPCELQLHYVVPAETLFVLGDNRATANDSRAFGAVPVANVIGHAVGVVWPPRDL